MVTQRSFIIFLCLVAVCGGLEAKSIGGWVSTARHDTALYLENRGHSENEIVISFRRDTIETAVLGPGQSVRFLASAVTPSGSGRIGIVTSLPAAVEVIRVDLEADEVRTVYKGIVEGRVSQRTSREACIPTEREQVHYTVRDANEDGVPDPEAWATVLVKDSCGQIRDAASIYPGSPGSVTSRGAEDRLDVSSWCGSFSIDLGNGCWARACSLTTSSGLTGRLISHQTTWDILCQDSAAFSDDPPTTDDLEGTSDRGQDYYDNCWRGATESFRAQAPLIVRDSRRLIERSFKRVIAAQIISLALTVTGAATGAPVVGVVADVIDSVGYAQDILEALGFDMTPTLSEAFNRRWGSGCQLLSAERSCQERTRDLFGNASFETVSAGQLDALLRSEDLNVRGVRNNCPN